MNEEALSLVHYSKAPLGPIRSVDAAEQGIEAKPKGLWFSVEKDEEDWLGWREWCEGAEFDPPGLAVETPLRVRDWSRIALLKTADDIDAFHALYGADTWNIPAAVPLFIDWRAVARDEDGIIVAPYCWARRLNGPAHIWYYGWDCASGCVWNADAIEVLDEREV